MIACLGMFTLNELVCDRCAWRDSCGTVTTASCSQVWREEVNTDTTQGEFAAQEEEPRRERENIHIQKDYPVRQSTVRDNRKYVLITAPRRL